MSSRHVHASAEGPASGRAGRVPQTHECRATAYFAHHKSAALRRAFVRGQQTHLKSLETAAACTVTAAGRLAELHTYADRMTVVSPQFDPTLTEPADDAIATITSDEENCEVDPEDFDCPVPPAEYQATAKTLRDAAAVLKGLATKVAAITPPRCRSAATTTFRPIAARIW